MVTAQGHRPLKAKEGLPLPPQQLSCIRTGLQYSSRGTVVGRATRQTLGQGTASFFKATGVTIGS